MEYRKLNAGCGRDIKDGWLNLDKKKLPGVNIVHDVEKLPLPFKEETFDEIVCQHVLEHTEYTAVLQDMHRVLRKGGSITIRVPHFTSKYNFIDPTHKKMFSISTFEFFIKDSRFKRDYYFSYHFSKISFSKITFARGIYLYNYLVEPIVNMGKNMQLVYESTGLSRIFPAEDIVIRLIK